jgi:hypothetical protein
LQEQPLCNKKSSTTSNYIGSVKKHSCENEIKLTVTVTSADNGNLSQIILACEMALVLK